jgi:hypothetical protein
VLCIYQEELSATDIQICSGDALISTHVIVTQISTFHVMCET